MWGPCLTKGGLEFCLHGWKWSSFPMLMPILIFWKAISQAFPKLAYPTHLLYGNTLPFVENSQGNVCITLYTHTHKKKLKIQAFHERNRELSLALYFSFYQIIP